MDIQMGHYLSAMKPPNVFFLTEQQRLDFMARLGNPLGLAPNLDLMARAGTHLVRTGPAYSPDGMPERRVV